MLAAVATAMLSCPLAFAAKGHCNLSADKNWIEKKNAIYAQSEDPNTKINGVDKATFNALIEKENGFLKGKNRNIPQSMSRCSNAENFDKTPNRPEIQKLKDFDKALQQKENLTCLCDNDTKKNKEGAEDPLQAKVDKAPVFADPATQKPAPHIASQEPDPAPYQTEPAQKTSPVLTDEQKTMSTLANPGSLSSDQVKMIEAGRSYSDIYRADFSPTDDTLAKWQPGPSFTDGKGRIYETWTGNGITWARLKPNY